MSRIEPWHQVNWDWRAAGNFIGGGSGTGLVILAAVATKTGAQDTVYWPLGLLGAVLVGIGLFCVWLEIGRPWRALHVFFHPQTSWMTREAFVSALLLPVTLIAVAAACPYFPLPSGLGVAGGAMWLAAILAAGYLFCQARILHASKGIPAWRHRALMPVIMITGLAEGCGFLLLGTAFFGGSAIWALALLIGLVLGRWLSWRRYLTELEETGAPRKALAALNSATPMINNIGHFGAAVVGVLAIIWIDAGPWLGALAGLLAIAGGWWMKFVVIARAAYNQGFALPLTPVRGTGEAGPGDKPGW